MGRPFTFIESELKNKKWFVDDARGGHVMKILFISTSHSYFLSHRVLLAKKCQKYGWDVHVAAPFPAFDKKIDELGFQQHFVNISRKPKFFGKEIFSLISVIKCINKIQPDIIHCHSLMACLIGGFGGLLTRTPTVFSPGGLATAFLGKGMRYLMIRFIIRMGLFTLLISNKSRIILQNSEEAKVLLVPFQKKRLRYVYGAGVDILNYKEKKYYKNKGAVKVLFLGRMLRPKGVVEYVNACREIKKRGLTADFLLAGGLDNGNEFSLTCSEIRILARDGLVRWLGHVDDIKNLLMEVDIVCLPSYSEGLPRSLIEAAAAAVPIVATDIPGNRIIVKNKITGLLVPVGDVERLADGLEMLIKTPELRREYGLNGRNHSFNFDINVVAKKTIEIYEEIVVHSC